MNLILNPDAGEFVPTAKEGHRHSEERSGYSLGRGEAEHRVVINKLPDSEGESVGFGMGWGRLNPAARSEGTHRARKQRINIMMPLFTGDHNNKYLVPGRTYGTHKNLYFEVYIYQVYTRVYV